MAQILAGLWSPIARSSVTLALPRPTCPFRRDRVRGRTRRRRPVSLSGELVGVLFHRHRDAFTTNQSPTLAFIAMLPSHGAAIVP
jgi:hypothetical protein